MKLTIEVEEINEGDLFLVHVKTVITPEHPEGTKVLQLFPVCKVCNEYYHPTRGHRAICDDCRKESL